MRILLALLFALSEREPMVEATRALLCLIF
jgi:hypothetical protein